jgi:hypothetical protein
MLLLGISSGSLAQVSSARQLPVAAPSLAGEACVLHVWPSATAKSSYMGWFHGGAVDGDRRGIKGYPDLHGRVLSTAVQQQLLRDIDWKTWAELPAASVVVHDQPPEAADDLGRTTPLITDRPDCYTELIVHSVFVERAALSTTTVRVMAITKRWQGNLTTPKTYSLMTHERAEFGAGDEQSIERSLKGAFTASIQQLLRSSYFHQH